VVLSTRCHGVTAGRLQSATVSSKAKCRNDMRINLLNDIECLSRGLSICLVVSACHLSTLVSPEVLECSSSRDRSRLKHPRDVRLEKSLQLGACVAHVPPANTSTIAVWKGYGRAYSRASFFSDRLGLD
jgi:hypothetical protein